MKLVLILVITLISNNIYARFGPITSGGGSGVKCLSSEGVTTYEVLDYHEAKIRYGENNILSGTGDWMEDSYNLARNAYRLQGVEDFSQVIKNFDIVKHNLGIIVNEIEWVGELPYLKDYGKLEPLPTNCELVQIAIYYDQQKKLKINRKIWDKLDSLNKAVLLQHEINYLLERKESEYNSLTSRAYVQQTLSAEMQAPVLDNANSAQYVCRSLQNKNRPFINTEFKFYVHILNGKTVFQFKNYDNRALFVKTTAEFKLNFEVANVLDPFSEEVAFPKSENANKVIISTLQGNHFSSGEVQLTYIEGKAITIQSFKNGISTSRKLKLSCKVNN